MLSQMVKSNFWPRYYLDATMACNRVNVADLLNQVPREVRTEPCGLLRREALLPRQALPMPPFLRILLCPHLDGHSQMTWLRNIYAEVIESRSSQASQM